MQPRRRFGISYYTASESDGGVVVQSVTVGSIAHWSGIRPGDIITHINGQSVQSAEQVLKVLGELCTLEKFAQVVFCETAFERDTCRLQRARDDWT